jgi:O-antigen/teichoic acid export membrane protein
LRNPITQLFGQTAVYGMGIVLPRVLNYLLLTPFYTRVFTKASYGVITELYAYVVFLLVILTYGMETGYFRFAGKSDERDNVYTSVLGAIFTTSLLFTGIVCTWSGSIGQALGYGANPEYIRWLAVIVGVDAFTSIPFARIRMNNRVIKYTLIRLAEVIVNIGLNLFFLYYCPRNPDNWLVEKLYNPGIGVGYVLISNLAASLVKMALLSGEIGVVFRSRFKMGILKQILTYSYPLLIAGLAGTVNEALDRVLLKHLLPAEVIPMEQLGIYGANYKLAVLMTLFIQMFRYAAEPFFFSKSEDKTARKLYADVMTFFMIAGLFIFLLVTLYMDYFILFIGSGFREGAGIVPVVLLANLVMGIFFNLSIWYKLTNKTMIGAVLVLTGAVITVVINVLFIPRYGYVASAWAHLLCYTVMVTMSYLWSRKYYKIPYRILRLTGYLALALGLFGINELFLRNIALAGDLKGFILISIFIIVAVLGERKTFKAYRNV